MNNENRWFSLLCITFIVVVFGGIFGLAAYKAHAESSVKIACYEAAKTNMNIKCEKL